MLVCWSYQVLAGWFFTRNHPWMPSVFSVTGRPSAPIIDVFFKAHRGAGWHFRSKFFYCTLIKIKSTGKTKNLEEWVVEEIISDHSHNFLPTLSSHFSQLENWWEKMVISIEKVALGPHPLPPYEASHTHLSFLQIRPAPPPSQVPQPTCIQPPPLLSVSC